jgi:2-succinyl-5-enolpyruvyl-6-hydroxy-3-cyclohexene-1-carboxylate synthase
MIPINRTYAPIQAIVDELARCGMRHAVTSPGSRNAPISLSLAADERIESVSVIDERAAGFMALGMAKASGRPVAVTCTSGTAAANLLPAVVEAHEARVPLIVLTADRPPELRDVGAGQAIDQIKIFGSAAKWFVEVGNGDPGTDWATHVRALACRAWWTAAQGRPGPVHLNLPLREPLAPVEEAMDSAPWQGRADGRPWVEVQAAAGALADEQVEVLAERIASTPRGAIVCGSAGEGLAEPIAALAARAGWPVLADPMSGLRCGAHDRSQVIAHYDPLLRSERFGEDSRPDLVLRIGDAPTSKALRSWLAGAPQVVIDPHGAWQEPTRVAETLLQADPALVCSALLDALERRSHSPDPAWLQSWRTADDLVPEVLAGIDSVETLEPRAYCAVEPVLPDGAIAWLSSSMPIRDVESFFPQSDRRVRFLANRGANGIDGVVSSAAGAALATGSPTWLLTGEIALLHDIGGLIAASRAGAELHIVCVNNGGGGIFDFLPVAEHADPAAFEQHVSTPSEVDLAAVAAVAGIQHRIASTVEEIRAATAEPGLVEIRADRAANVRGHQELIKAVKASVEGFSPA